MIVSLIPTWDLRIVVDHSGKAGRLQQKFKHPDGGGPPVWQNVPVARAADLGPADATNLLLSAENTDARRTFEEDGYTASTENAQPFSLADHLRRQRAFSLKTFGPGQRCKGVVDHIRKELNEIEADPEGKGELEWIDVIILGFDGALRDDPDRPVEEIIARMVAKQTKNEGRNWPDWRTADPNKAIEHDRTGEQMELAVGEAGNDPRTINPCPCGDNDGLWCSLEGCPYPQGVSGASSKFMVGDQVEKFTGDYRARGEVRGIFVMKKGALRYVVEHEVAGGGSFCHIYSEGQLRLLEREASDAG